MAATMAATGGRRQSQSSTISGRRRSLGKAASTPNLEATHHRLRDILLGKDVHDSSAGGRRNPVQAVDPGLTPVGEDAGDQVSPPPSPPAGGGDASINAQESPKVKGSLSVEAESKNVSKFGDDREKDNFMAQVCSDSTRLDVRDWVGRIYETLKKLPAKEEGDDSLIKGKRHRKAWSSSGHSDTTTHTGTTSALLTAGGSIAATQPRHAPSLISAESMVVHPGKKIELLSTEERVRAILSNEIPELSEHVTQHCAKRAEGVRREIDEELVESHLLTMRRQQVFSGQANLVRWQNSRRLALQKRLDTEMPFWMLEAVKTWNQQSAMQAREDDVSEQDLVFDYLTKRAAHINTSKLATEIPIFKTLHSSYSLPRMWRDKYLEMGK
jgi:hypothetical protein